MRNSSDSHWKSSESHVRFELRNPTAFVVLEKKSSIAAAEDNRLRRRAAQTNTTPERTRRYRGIPRKYGKFFTKVRTLKTTLQSYSKHPKSSTQNKSQ